MMHAIDFSAFPENDVFMERTEAWVWVMNIPDGWNWPYNASERTEWGRIVAGLQNSRGCANVKSGNSRDPITGEIVRGQIGVYIYPHGVRHRMDGHGHDGRVFNLCRCESAATKS